MEKEQLIPNTTYKIVYNQQWCHVASANNKSLDVEFHTEGQVREVIFIGLIEISKQKRNIFYSVSTGQYYMFGVDNLDYIITPEQESLIKAIESTEEHLNNLKQQLYGSTKN